MTTPMPEVRKAPERPASRILRRGAAAAPWLLLVSFLICKGEDLDTWFHLGAGRWIAARRAVPRLDPFSFTAASRLYIDSHWLFQALLYGLHRLGGLPLLLLFQASCFLTAVALVARSVGDPEPPEALWTGLLLLAPVVADRILLRPDMVTFLFLGIFWRVLFSDAPCGRAALWVLPAVEALWVNMHGLFPLGPALMGCAAAGVLAARFLPLPERFRRAEERGVSWREMSAAGLAVLAACLATPYGLDGLRYAVQLYREMGGGADLFMQNVTELKSPSAVYQQSPALVLYRAILAASLASLLLNLKRIRLSELAAYLAFLCLARMTVRNTAYFALLAVPFTVRNVSAWRRGRRPWPPAARRAAQAALLAAGLASSWLVATDRYYIFTKDTKRFGMAWNPFLSPDGALDFAERAGLRGNCLNDIMLGGYMIWRRGPARPVFVDGRLEVYGPEFLAAYKLLTDAPAAAWDETTRKFGIEYAVLTGLSPYSEKIVEFLARRPDWPLVWADGFAAVYARRDGINHDAIARILEKRKGLFDRPAQPDAGRSRWRVPGAVDFPLAELTRAKFALLAGDYAQARQGFEDALRVDPGSLDARFNLGALFFRLGRPQESEREFLGILKSRKSQPRTMAALGAVYLSEGKIDEAIPVLENAVRLEPGLGTAHASLGTAYYQRGNYEGAAQSLRTALAYVPNDPTTHFNLGACLLKLRRPEPAVAELKKALELNPGYAKARQALAAMGATP